MCFVFFCRETPSNNNYVKHKNQEQGMNRIENSIDRDGIFCFFLLQIKEMFNFINCISSHRTQIKQSKAFA